MLLFLLGLFNCFVDSNLYLAFHPFLVEAALGRQVVKVSISFYAGQRRLLFFTEQRGHASTRVTEIYLQMVGEEQRRLVMEAWES